MAIDRKATAYDAHIGARMRECRLLRGLSGHQVAGKIGVTAQQVFKYETGFSRATAGQLFQIARVLKTPIAFFYEGLDHGHPAGVRRRLLLELMSNFAEIPDEKYKGVLSSIVRTLAGR
jgi:transcriptional regulator with XRE-family HTH domain